MAPQSDFVLVALKFISVTQKVALRVMKASQAGWLEETVAVLI